MELRQNPFQDEERSPLLWENKKKTLFVGTAGHIRHQSKGRLFPPAQAYYLGVVWGVQGEIVAEIDGQAFWVCPDTACLISNGSQYQLKIISDSAEFIYMSLDGESSEQVLPGYDLWEGVFRSGKAPVAQVINIMDRLALTRESQIRVTLVEGLDLLKAIQLNHYRTTRDRAVLDAKILIHRRWNDPQFNINAVYDILQTRRSSLAIKFKRRTGQTMLDYLHGLRLRATVRMLGESNLPVPQIAHDCGFSDPS